MEGELSGDVYFEWRVERVAYGGPVFSWVPFAVQLVLALELEEAQVDMPLSVSALPDLVDVSSHKDEWPLPWEGPSIFIQGG